MLNLLTYITSIFSIFFKFSSDYALINLSNYTYPSPKDQDITYIPIIATTDLHGYGFPRSPLKSNKFSYGGASLLSSYIEAIRLEWGKSNVWWFDAGDKYKGALESTISNGTIMTEIFNYIGLDLSVLGNHDFDDGLDHIMNQMNQTQSPFLTTNILNKWTNMHDSFNNTRNYFTKRVFSVVNGIKIGVIGFTPYFEYVASKDEINNSLIFLGIKEGITEEALSLKANDKVNAVILLVHQGIICNGDSQELNAYNKSHSSLGSLQHCDKENELYKYLDKIEPGIIDAVIGGHVHFPSHHFINNIPIVHSVDKGVQFHILYLPFKKGSNEYLVDKVVIEGPIPICSWIAKDTLTCTTQDKDKEMSKFIFHNSIIRNDKRIERKVLDKYKNQFSKYRKYLCDNRQDWIRTKDENVIGNWFSDIIREAAAADVAIINNSGWRVDWNEGPIYWEDVFNMNPFEGDVETFIMNGKELAQTMKILQNSKRRYYQTSGLRQVFNKNESGEYELKHLYRNNGEEIMDSKEYKVTVNSYIFIREKENFNEIFKFYIMRGSTKVGIFNEIVSEYLLKAKEIKKERYFNEDVNERRLVFEENGAKK